MRRLALLLLFLASGVAPEAQPALRLSPDTLDFGEVPVGATVGGDFVRIESVGDEPITIKIHATFRPFFMPFDQRYVMRAASPPEIPTRNAPIEVTPFRTGYIGADVAVDTDERGAYVEWTEVVGVEPVAPTLASGERTTRTLEVRNPGQLPVTATTGPLAAWLSLSPQMLDLAPATGALVEATIDASGLAPGVYRDTLVYTGSPDFFWRVPVALTVTGSTATEPARGPAAELLAPGPNPASGAVQVRYRLAEPGDVDLRVVDALGREVAVLTRGRRPRGEHAATWHPEPLAAGVYAVVLRVGDVRQRRAVVVTR
ncbi:MAG: hypothetical protein AAFQ43_13475 [Bacteroidota bacterium]